MDTRYKRLIILVIGIMLGIGGLVISLKVFDKKEEAISTPMEERTLADEMFISNVSNLVFTNISKNIDLGSVVPTLDKFGVMNDMFSFTVKNLSANNKNYTLSLMDNDSTILNKMIRYEIIKNNESLGVYTLSDDGIIDISEIPSNGEITYGLKMWLNYNSEVKVGRLSKKVCLVENNELLDKSGASKPSLVDGMIPVYYDFDTMSYYKAPEEISYYHTWYNYDKNLYANAVTVNKEKRDEYLKSSVGTKISMNDINGIWVWVPRFNYQINNRIVDVHFVDSGMEAHSAFNFNKEARNGFWISKFEAGLSNDDACITSLLTVNCNKNDKVLLFKPGVPLMNKITMANLFYSIRKMELKNNIYGFNGNGSKVNNDGTIKGDNNNFDIHMIRNSEWEAVAILVLSKYGNNKIMVNNSDLTGYSFDEEKSYPFNTINFGEKASTTGNITGIYDMVGGKAEMVMLDLHNKIFNKKSNSGFTTKVKEYYYDTKTEMDTLKDLLKNEYDNSGEIIVRGGYKRMNSGILSMYSVKDYVNKISLETNSRAVITIKEKNNG